MAKIVMARIDHRLLHGIVATQWAPASGANRMMIIDDTVANDFLLKESMKLAKPAGMALSIISLNTALMNFAVGKYGEERIFLVVKQPATLVALASRGVAIPVVNIGSTAVVEHGFAICSRAMGSAEDMEMYRQLIDHGARISIQFVPIDKAQPFLPVLEKYRHKRQEA